MVPCAHRASLGPKLPSKVPAATCGELHPGSSQVPICLRSLDAHPIVVLDKVIIRIVTPANQGSLVTLPIGTLGGSAGGCQKDWILGELNV